MNEIIETNFDNNGNLQNTENLKQTLKGISDEQKRITSTLTRLVGESALGACNIQEEEDRSFTLPDLVKTEEDDEHQGTDAAAEHPNEET